MALRLRAMMDVMEGQPYSDEAVAVAVQEFVAPAPPKEPKRRGFARARKAEPAAVGTV